jgi:hypothetical protein
LVIVFYLLAIILFNQDVETYLAHHCGFFLFYAKVNSPRSISIKNNVAKLHDTFVQFLAFFWHKSCWRQIIFMTYFSHFSSPILTFICLFSTTQISRIIATISRWSTMNCVDHDFEMQVVMYCLRTKNDHFTNPHKESLRVILWKG